MLDSNFYLGLVIGLVASVGIGAVLYLMNQGSPDVIKRIVSSKKVILLMVPTVTTSLTALLGFDPTGKLMLVIDTVFGALSMFQFVLDIVHGSASDGTLKDNRQQPEQVAPASAHAFDASRLTPAIQAIIATGGQVRSAIVPRVDVIRKP